MTQTPTPEEDAAVRGLYARLLDAWNRRAPADVAPLFLPEGGVIGFDGSEDRGAAQIAASWANIFANHPTARYVHTVRTVEKLGADAALLRAVAGMVPPGGNDINPAVNAHHTMIALKRDGEWKVLLYQNTPAQYHGRPELTEQLTAELRQLL
jgi:uncharacterized protein (TIGR02246 family)